VAASAERSRASASAANAGVAAAGRVDLGGVFRAAERNAGQGEFPDRELEEFRTLGAIECLPALMPVIRPLAAARRAVAPELRKNLALCKVRIDQ
jgi:hypothetical protein